MKVVWMNGGLGNQAFQYIFYRYLQINSGDDCLVDDRFFFEQPQHNGYEIERVFGLRPKLLSRVLDEAAWARLLRLSAELGIIRALGLSDMPVSLLSEGDFYSRRYASLPTALTGKYYSISPNGYEPQIARLPENLYYHGYWINHRWFLDVRDTILKELSFPEADDARHAALAQNICSCCSIGVHVRRGDFVTLGWSLGSDFYRESVARMRAVFQEARFFLVSDDPDWCRANRRELGFEESDDLLVVEGNSGLNSFRDMQALTLCRHLIISNSTFSYLAALLNRNPDKLVLNPTARTVV